MNESVERRNFRQRSQQPGESFDDFVLSLRELAKTCNFCSDECLQKNIRDQIIGGLLDGDAVEILLREKDLSLATTIDKCRAQEAARKQRGEIAGTTPRVGVLRQQADRLKQGALVVHDNLTSQHNRPTRQTHQVVGHHHPRCPAQAVAPTSIQGDVRIVLHTDGCAMRAGK